jgi:ATP-binding cassette subfamily B protein/subfamily B ATP-binding cassette protein MsbA
VLITMLAGVGLSVLQPWPVYFLINYVFKQQPLPPSLARLLELFPGPATAANLVAWCVGATVLIFLLSWALGVVTGFTNIALGQRMVFDLAADLFARLQQLSLRFHNSRSVGDNIRRVTNDSSCISVILKDALIPMVSALVSLLTMFGVMWHLDAKLTLLALVVVPWLALVFRLYAGPMAERGYAQQEIEGRIYDVVEQTFSAIPVVQAFGQEEINEGRFAKTTRAALTATLANTRVQVQFTMLVGLATAAGTAAVLWLGGEHALAAHLNLGGIFVFITYLGSLYAPLDTLMYSSSTIQEAAGSARRVREVLETEREVADKPGAAALPVVRGHVAIERVTFGYDPARPVLREVSLEARPGEIVALVGPTGAGKTTLVSLIPRFFDPQAGRVSVDGQDVREVQLRSLRQNIALVLQEPFLFPLSLEQNIAYGRPEATTAQIEAAARAANIHDFIRGLPTGYQTLVGERGASLSGGQRQRLSIARALLKDAPILILDEPTSSVDAETEHSILEALERLMEKRTTFIIAHRLSTVRRADRIVVLDQGAVVETGSHSELLSRAGLYAAFHQRQFGESQSTI